MELALYCPECGFYEKDKDRVGKRGDFITSVSVGSLFGELLAVQFAEWLEEDAKGVPQIIEIGAHDGRLAKDVLSWFREHRPELFGRMKYWIVEASERRRGWQAITLSEFQDRTLWSREISEIEAVRDLVAEQRIIFSNEFFDAIPVHRFGWDAESRMWFEWGVMLKGTQFAWSRLDGSRSDERKSDGARKLLKKLVEHGGEEEGRRLLEVLPDNLSVDVCPEAERWWLAAAQALPRGRLVGIDYGLTTEEVIVPHRLAGTLRAYRDHKLSNDLLAEPGEQDLTAHVNFTLLREAGESAGLTTDRFETQEQFLTRIALNNPGVLDWSAAQKRQFQTLTRPEMMGRAFRVLVQARGAGKPGQKQLKPA